MICLYCIFFVVLIAHWITILLSQAKRKSLDLYTQTCLFLFVLIDILAIWNASALV